MREGEGEKRSERVGVVIDNPTLDAPEGPGLDLPFPDPKEGPDLPCLFRFSPVPPLDSRIRSVLVE